MKEGKFIITTKQGQDILAKREFSEQEAKVLWSQEVIDAWKIKGSAELPTVKKGMVMTLEYQESHAELKAGTASRTFDFL